RNKEPVTGLAAWAFRALCSDSIACDEGFRWESPVSALTPAKGQRYLSLVESPQTVCVLVPEKGEGINMETNAELMNESAEEITKEKLINDVKVVIRDAEALLRA